MIRAITYAIKQSFVNLLRNKNMSTASIFSITAMLLILGLFFIITVNVNMLAESAKNQFDTIQIYLKDDVDRDKAQDIMDSIQSTEQIKEVKYVSKDEALQILKKRWGSNEYLLEGLESNPLPNAIEVKVSKLEYADAVVEKVKGTEGIEDIKYYKSIVDKLLNITNFVQTAAMIIISALIIISVVIVSNTVKLTVLAREREISIMKYIGATNWFIRGPFFVEGILIGFISSIISISIIGVIYSNIVGAFEEKSFVLFSMSMVPHHFLIFNLVWIFIALGVSIGSLGSILSMRRFLDT